MGEVLDQVGGNDGGQRAPGDDVAERRTQLPFSRAEVDLMGLEAPLADLGECVSVDVDPNVVEAQLANWLGNRRPSAAEVKDDSG